jgi:hypothetical protein
LIFSKSSILMLYALSNIPKGFNISELTKDGDEIFDKS